MVAVELGCSDKQEGCCIIVDTEYRDRDLIRSAPGARYDSDLHRWTIPLTWTGCKVLRGLFHERLVVGDKLVEWARQEWFERIQPALEARSLTDAEGDPALYPFQRAGVKFLATVKRAMLADEMGTGKTIQTIRTLADLVSRGENPFPCLVICPNSMKFAWQREFERWWPDVEVTVMRGSQAKRVAQISGVEHVLVTNWEAVRTHSRLAPFGSLSLHRCCRCDSNLSDTDKANSPIRCERCPKELNQRTWRTVVVDEAHRMKDPKAKQTRAAWACATPDTKYRFALTGTPIANSPIDLWPALHFLDEKSWPSRQKYIDRYVHLSYNPFGGYTVVGLDPEHRQEFFEITDPITRRMPKDAVLPFLPKKSYVQRVVEMSPKQRQAYKQMEQMLIAQLDSGVLVATSPLTKLTRLVQFASAYAELDDAGKVRLSDPSCKVEALVDVLEDLDTEPLVVFAMSRQLIMLAAHKLAVIGITHRLVVGGQSDLERAQSISDFQEGRARVILCTLGAGGVGITLSRSPNACFLQRSWSMVENVQAEDRVHRIGSEIHDKVNIIDIVTYGTVEERIRDALTEKGDQLQEFVRDRAFLSWLLARDKAAA